MSKWVIKIFVDVSSSKLTRWSLPRLQCSLPRLRRCSYTSSPWEPGFTQRWDSFFPLGHYLLLLLKMVGQQEKDSSEEWHCHGNHKIRPVWLPHRHCAQVLYINIDIARSDTYSVYYESANSNILPSRDDIKPTTKREESSVRMVPDQVSWKNFEITFGYIKGF